jgi:TatD DNase family protein
MDLSFIDTHSHLYADEFVDDFNDVVDRAQKGGVNKILLPNIDTDSYEAMMRLSVGNPDLFKPMIGLHPCSVKLESYKTQLEYLQSKLESHTFIAIGEIGMDLYWDTSTEGAQTEALQIQCGWAAEHDLPIALHTRNATKQVIQIIKDLDLPKLTGVFHCFGDGLEEAEEIIEMGFKLGIGGVLTFKNGGLDRVIQSIDLKHLILETDAPYLAPAPYRGKRNESAYIPIIAQKLANVKETSIEEVAKITSKNAIELFRI